VHLQATAAACTAAAAKAAEIEDLSDDSLAEMHDACGVFGWYG